MNNAVWNNRGGGVLSIDASPISLDRLKELSATQIEKLVLTANIGSLRIDEIFEVDVDESCCDASRAFVLILQGDLSSFDNLCSETTTGITILQGNAGHDFAVTQRGGAIYVEGSLGQRAFSDKRDGLCMIAGNVADRFGAPLPGKLQGVSGGDSILLGDVGDRACERMRRGTICVAGRIGSHLAHQWIAGTILALQPPGPFWGAQMRRGSLILCSDSNSDSAATLSPPRPLELSFLPILWKHLQSLLSEAESLAELSSSFKERCSQLKRRLPVGRHVLRSVGDLECDGQGEVLVLQGSSQSD